MIVGIAALLSDRDPRADIPASVASTPCSAARPTTIIQLGRTSASTIARIVRRGENQIVRHGRATGATASASVVTVARMVARQAGHASHIPSNTLIGIRLGRAMKTRRQKSKRARKTGAAKVTARKARPRRKLATGRRVPAETKTTGERSAATRARQATPPPQHPSRLANAAEMLGALAGRVAAVADRLPWAKGEPATASSKDSKDATPRTK